MTTTCFLTVIVILLAMACAFLGGLAKMWRSCALQDAEKNLQARRDLAAAAVEMEAKDKVIAAKNGEIVKLTTQVRQMSER